MAITPKRRALSPQYVSENQLTIEGFETPFAQQLSSSNRWVVLAKQIPWDELSGIYHKNFKPKQTGRPGISSRVAIGSIIIKHMCNLDDRETVAQISENMYMQFFLGYSSFSAVEPFDPSLFVEFRKRLGDDVIKQMNDKILEISRRSDQDNTTQPEEQVTHKGKLLFDATACPQDIAYPTDLNLLSEGREQSERIIDLLYEQGLHTQKPRTYRQIARKEYLKVAQKKVKHKKGLRKAIRRQLGFLNRNLKSINKLLDNYAVFPLKPKDQKCLWVLNTLYEQQQTMFETNTHSIVNRIVSIHQPHVRPIVRGKTTAKVEFGAKIHVSLIDGYSFLDTISWEAFSEGKHLVEYVNNYKNRFGYYPEQVLADKAYCSRENRKWLKAQGIQLIAKALGRPRAEDKDLVRPGERNPIEGKFGQAKTAYGMNRIKARLLVTSQSWIASIILVLNLVKLAGQAPLCLWLSYSARMSFYLMKIIKQIKTGGYYNPPVLAHS